MWSSVSRYPRKKLCLCVSLGEQSGACGPWKLSNNNSTPAKSPHLLGHTTLSCWFLSICSPTHPNIPANCCGSYHQCWLHRVADVLNPTQRHTCKLCFICHFGHATGVERLKATEMLQSLPASYPEVLLPPIAGQTDCTVLHLHKGRPVCFHFNIQELSWAYGKFIPALTTLITKMYRDRS